MLQLKNAAAFPGWAKSMTMFHVAVNAVLYFRTQTHTFAERENPRLLQVDFSGMWEQILARFPRKNQDLDCCHAAPVRRFFLTGFQLSVFNFML